MTRFFLRLGLVSIIFGLINYSPVGAANIPIAVTAVSDPVFIYVGDVEYTMTFWNVGSNGGSQYAGVTVTGKCLSAGGDWSCEEGESLGGSSGTFTGGPNGTFSIEGFTFNLVDGQTAALSAEGYEIVFHVQNPTAFANWDDENLSKEDYDAMKLPTEEDWSPQPADAMPDYSFPTVNKVMGDVEISDPTNRSGIVDSIWRGYWGDPEPWRQWESGTSGQQIKSQSSIKTGTGRAILEFSDGTKFILERDSQITFNASGGFTIETGGGYMEYRKYGHKIILQTRRGKFAIIGTTVSWDVDGDHIQFLVIEGQVEADPDDGSETITLEAGQEVLADEFGMSGAMNFDPENSLERWQTIEEEIIAAEAANADTNTKTGGANYWWWIIGVVAVLAIIVLILIVIVVIVVLVRKRK